MATPYLSEIRVMSFSFAPKGWAFCNGQLLAIAQNQALFALLGTTYGGDGIRTFALPNLQGRAPLHFGSDHSGNAYSLGQFAGQPTHALTLTETPSHTHTMSGVVAAGDPAPEGVLPSPKVALAEAAAVEGTNPTVAVSIYSMGPANTTMASTAVGLTGSGQGHENRQPYLTLNFCIALQGIFPSRT